MPEIVGRDEELARLRAFAGRPGAGTAALLLEGEPGIGKSTLWLAGVEAARAQGLRVLVSRPAEAEQGFAYAGLGDLLEGVLDDVLPALPPPRRRALEVALLLEDDDATADAVDPRALGIATRSALELLAGERPVLVAIDDLQWFDAASASALAFALRRLETAPVRLLLARRLGDGSAPSELERALGEADLQRVPVAALSVGALHRLLRDQLGKTFARQTLLRVHERSGGNPFFALELARVLDVDADPSEPLPVPETLDELVRARISGLPAPTRDALALAAALGTASDSVMERAGFAPAVLEPALAAGVIERERGAIRFAHPLLASLLYADLGDARRGVHGRIAAIVDDPVLRARHLALSTDMPDAVIADALDAAGALAGDRGASAAAAELAEQALRLTPLDAPTERHRRALAAARAQKDAGEWTRARSIATDLLDEALGPLRADGLVLLAELESVERSAVLLEEALREAASRPALQSLIHSRLAWAKRFRAGFRGALVHAHAALEIADRLGDDALRARALIAVAELSSCVGDVEAPVYTARACELAGVVGDARLVKSATLIASDMLVWGGEDDRARELLDDAYATWSERDELYAAHVLWSLAWVEFGSGRWELAADLAARALDVVVQYGLEQPPHHLPAAWIAVHRGQLEQARAQSERALELAAVQMGLHPPLHLGVLGLAALWGGDASAGAAWLDKADEQAQSLGWGEPSMRRWSGDHVEALLEVGRLDEAVRVLERWEEDATRLRRARVLAHVVRCRGLVAAAQGAVDPAVALLEEAAEQHERAGDVFGRSRALLALGVVRRRARQKSAAREAIAAALAGFDQLGAATWSRRARDELGSIGGRTRDDGLSPAERRVALLVAEGRTNREVAAALFLGERTVASHLTHIYAKLGVRSRTELARRLQ